MLFIKVWCLPHLFCVFVLPLLATKNSTYIYISMNFDCECEVDLVKRCVILRTFTWKN